MKTKLLFYGCFLKTSFFNKWQFAVFALLSIAFNTQVFANDTTKHNFPEVEVNSNFGCDGGQITGGPFEFCVGDGKADNVSGIELTGNDGQNSQWVITDSTGKILGLPGAPEAVDFDGAGAGLCLIWHLSYSDGLTGLVAGNNVNSDLHGTYSFSNSISVYRNQPEGGVIEGGPFEFIVGDGEDDFVWVGINGASGANAQWVITDEAGVILGLPSDPEVVNFEGAGEGTCLIWYLSYSNGLTGLTVGNNATTDLEGCYDFSDPVKVVRKEKINGGEITGGPFTFCVGDGVADNVSGIELTWDSGTNSQWVITDDKGKILGLPPSPEAVNFDGAGAGTCLIWHLSYADGLTGLVEGNNALTDLKGRYDFSNNIHVYRNQPEAGEISGGPFEFFVDGEVDNVSGITLDGTGVGSNSTWVITDDQGNILGLPPTLEAVEGVDFDGAGAGTCLIWYLRYEDGLEGAAVGKNANDLEGCFDLSNALTVVRKAAPNAGEIAGGPFNFCVDGEVDNVSGITLDGTGVGSNSTWVITDDKGNILGLPPTLEAVEGVDFDGAGAGTCLIWYLRYEDGLEGAAVGKNANDLQGYFDLSNPLTVVRSQPEAGEISGGPFEFFVDGEVDNVSGITLDGTGVGSNSTWVITDDQGNILGLPPTLEAVEGVDFDGAGAGTCLIWYLRYEDGLEGAAVGKNANDLEGCFDLSNPLTVVRKAAPNAGEIAGGPFNLCVDGEVDNVSGITLDGTGVGSNSTWVITDDQGNILGLPPTLEAVEGVDFDGAGAGTCLIWYLRYEDGLEGAAVGKNANDLQGYFDLSNPLTVVRSQPEAGEISGGPFEFFVDGEVDNVSGITLDGTGVGSNSTWVITDDQGNILGLPPTLAAVEGVDFDGAGAGTCLIWYLRYEDGLEGAAVGKNANDLEGCFDLSNALTVVRKAAPNAGEIAGGPFNFCVDGEVDNVSGITLDGTGVGSNSTWVITDDKGNILGLPPTLEAVEGVDFDGAGAGTCLIWYLRYEDGLEGAAVGKNANDLQGYFDLSNPLTVVRSQPEAGEISGGPFEFFVDGEVDNVSGITLDGTGVGSNSTWIITDDQGNILGLPPTLEAVEGVDFDGAGAGTCLIWYLRYEDGLEGAAVGKNANDLEGCFDLSNPLTVVRKIHVNGGEITGGPFEFCVGDGIADNVSGIELTWDSGANSQWVITDDTGKILGLPPTPEAVDFDGAGAGVCLIWHLSYDDGLVGLEVGNNALTDLFGTYDFSNNIHVYRNQPEAGEITGGPFRFFVDGEADYVSEISLDGNGVGSNSTWVITDEDGTILGLPPTLAAVESVDFDEAGPGTCFIWYLRYEDGLIGAEKGKNANDLEGCFDLSNPIKVTREDDDTMNGKLTVYPNPATNVIKVAMSKMDSKKMNISLFDFSGSNITHRMQRTNTDDEIVFSLHSLPRGIYLMKVNDGNGKSFTKKVVLR